MDPDALLAIGREAVLLMVLVSLPPLLAGMAAGLVAGLIQTATQIQEPSLTTVPRLGAAFAALVLAGPWIAAQLVRFTARVLTALVGVQL